LRPPPSLKDKMPLVNSLWSLCADYLWRPGHIHGGVNVKATCTWLGGQINILLAKLLVNTAFQRLAPLWHKCIILLIHSLLQ
jgi:hypothetical protein